MPALTEAQRQKQIAIARQGKAKSKPKPGQAGAGSTVKGAKTKAGTIGGGNVSTPRPTASNKPKPKVSSPATGGRYIPGSQQIRFKAAPTAAPLPPPPPVATNDLWGASAAAPAPLPLPAPAPAPTSSPYVGSSAATPARPNRPVPAASETYKDGGKGRYQGTQAYRDAIGGSGNPLLNRLRKDLGRDLKTGERVNSRAQSPAEYNVSEEEGRRRLGQQPPTSRAQSPAEYNVSKEEGLRRLGLLSPTAAALSAQYAGNDEPGRLGQADNPLAAIAEALQMVSQAPSKKTLKIAKPKRRNERF